MASVCKISLISILLALAGCASTQPKQDAQKPADVPPEYRLTATVKDIMDALVDPGSESMRHVKNAISNIGIPTKSVPTPHRA